MWYTEVLKPQKHRCHPRYQDFNEIARVGINTVPEPSSEPSSQHVLTLPRPATDCLTLQQAADPAIELV